jgi:hypothetical protein
MYTIQLLSLCALLLLLFAGVAVAAVLDAKALFSLAC